MKIIGITGTIGAGKGTIVEYLVTHKGFRHFSVRDYLVACISEAGDTVNRDTMADTANRLRAKHGSSFIVEELYNKAAKGNEDAVIESIRNAGEINALREKEDFILFSVDAGRETRYERIVKRGSVTDGVSFETFCQNEDREMNSTDPNKQNLLRCMELADVHFNNDGTFESLYSAVDKALENI